ncbi:hypothetical protein ACFY3N_28770 [Streptomyces sp. NPDC000348]|uniref:hypothetical protein n=1 Tax=Streptomyces sp. NPDC000348 TaxID=3364538 RepID=UPI0036937EAC
MGGRRRSGLPPGTATAAPKAVRCPDPAPGTSGTADGSHTGAAGGSRLNHGEGPAGTLPRWIRAGPGGTVEAGRTVLEPPTGREARTRALSVEGGTYGSPHHAAHRSGPDTGSTVTVDFRSATSPRPRPGERRPGWNAAQLPETGVYGGDDGGNPEEPPIETPSAIHSFVATRANDRQRGVQGESTGHPATLTVEPGADTDPSGVVVELGPGAGGDTVTPTGPAEGDAPVGTRLAVRDQPAVPSLRGAPSGGPVLHSGRGPSPGRTPCRALPGRRRRGTSADSRGELTRFREVEVRLRTWLHRSTARPVRVTVLRTVPAGGPVPPSVCAAGRRRPSPSSCWRP